MNDEKHDANPWDDDDGGRTLATDGPSFEMPSNIPSPITAPPPPPPPPPAASPKQPLKATLVGLMPDDFLAGVSNPGARQAATPRAHPRPVTIPDEALDDLRPRDDSLTLASASSAGFPLPAGTARPDAYAPPERIDEETVALMREESRLPNLADEPEPEEATRALTREEMKGRPSAHQDAHVIVGSGAAGDDATVAIGVNALNADFGELGASLDPALAEALARAAERHPHTNLQQPPAPSRFFSPPLTGQAPRSQAQPPPQSWQDGQSWQDPQSWQEPGPAAYAPSGPHPALGGPPVQPMPWGPAPHAPTAPTYTQHQQQPQQGIVSPQQAPWMQPPVSLPQTPAPGGGRSLGGIRITSQVMILACVGVVCLGVFVIGLVLFFTTKF